ncbi:MAG: alpha/beta fold hydrolase [Opitutales bacterium]
MHTATDLPDAVRDLYPFRGKHLEQEPGVRQHYLCEGEGRAGTVVLVHGNPTWSFFYRDWVRHLVDHGIRCIVPDHIGCGLSDKPPAYPYRLAQHQDNLAAILKQEGVDHYSLVVHDWGGAIGLGVAARHPGCIGRIAILNTAAFPMRRIPLRIALCRLPGLGPFVVRRFNAFAGPAIRLAVVNPLPGAVAEGYRWPYRTAADRVAIAAFVQDIPLAPDHPSWATLQATASGLAAFKDKPVSLFWGERDFCFDQPFLAEWQHRLPNATVHRLPGVGHYVPEDGGQELAKRVGAFLADSS